MGIFTLRLRLTQLFFSILPQQFVDVITPGLTTLQERLEKERPERAQVRAGHVLRSIVRKAAAKDAERGEHRPLGVAQRGPRSVKDNPYAAMAIGHVAQVGL